MRGLSDFERLVETVGLIARHPDFPGKQQVVERCSQEIGELSGAGRITAVQGQVLRETLLGICPGMSRHQLGPRVPAAAGTLPCRGLAPERGPTLFSEG